MIYVVGIGPGGLDEITPRALEALRSCDAISGYRVYIDMVRDFLPGKILMSYPMGRERERCQRALQVSRELKKDVALISSGDAGVYGMAGLMLEVASGSGEEVRVIPGITSANSCAAILGAPLMNDYAVVSLSDLMTSWQVIERRLIAACIGDFVICIYNPASNHRPENFRKACDVLLYHGMNPERPAGYVRNAGREGEYSEVSTLGKLKGSRSIDMFCTVIIGNSRSYVLDGKIITPRGYELTIARSFRP